MSTRRKVGFSSSSSEASRRQLMQPVQCWEKVWTLPDNAPPNSTLRVYKWVKTDMIQHFSDDEGESDQPLAPLPDEPEAVDGDDDMEQDDEIKSVAPDSATAPASREVSEPLQPREESKPATPKPHPLSVSFQPPSPSPAPHDQDDGLDDSLKPPEGNLDGDLSLDMTGMGPDGEAFENAGDMSQLQSGDALLGGGPLLDETMEEDPFANGQSA